MKDKKANSIAMGTSGQKDTEKEPNGLKANRSPDREQPARPLGTQPAEAGAEEGFECACSNCGHIVPKVADVPCPPCPVCAGPMDSI